MYKQPIIVFGIVIPLVIAGAIFGVGSVVKGKFTTTYDTKVVQFKDFKRNKIFAKETETQVTKQREVFDQWTTILEQDAFSLVASNLRSITEKMPPKEIQQPFPERLDNKLGFGLASAQDSTSVRFNLKGSYRTIQKALIQLETRMPNLQLQDMRMEPTNTPEGSVLNVQVSYTAWEK